KAGRFIAGDARLLRRVPVRFRFLIPSAARLSGNAGPLAHLRARLPPGASIPIQDAYKKISPPGWILAPVLALCRVVAYYPSRHSAPTANVTTHVPPIHSRNLHAKLSIRRRRLRRPKRTCGG